MSWHFSGSGHFNGEDAEEKEQRLIDALKSAFESQGLPNDTDSASVSFNGQFAGQQSLTIRKD